MADMRRYSFVSEWTVAQPRDAVHAVLIDLERYPEWWPQVLAVGWLGPDDGLVLCRSVLPYTLELRLHAVHRQPGLLETTIDGDLRGWVRWRLGEVDGGTRLRLEQQVEVSGGLLGLASYAARPLLRWNHDRMMTGARMGLSSRLS
jgi:uncharacterized protein YndB with AHSA1/START domain